MTWNYSNTSVQTTLTSDITNSATTFAIGDTSGLPASFPYSLILDYGAATVEVVNVTSVSGLNVTVTRGQNGTSAQAHSAGAVVVHGVVARDLQEPQDHIAASSNIHGVGASSAVVGTQTTQTLTNKSIDASGNTLTNIPNSAITSLAASKLTGNYNGGANFAGTVDGTVVLTATGTATQTGNLFEAYKGATAKLTVSQAGNVSAAGSISSSAAGVTANTVLTGQGTGDVVPIVADVPNANVTDLMQLKRNSSVKAKFDKDGVLTCNNANVVTVTSTGNGSFTGSLSSGTGLTAGTNLTVNNNATITGNETVGGTLGVTGATTLSGTLAVTGAVTTTTDINVGGWLVVTGETWHSFTYDNSWANGSTGSPLKYRKIGLNCVQIIGVTKSPGTFNSQIATLPSGYRPATNDQGIWAWTNEGSGQLIRISSSGTLVAFGSTTTNKDWWVNGIFSLEL